MDESALTSRRDEAKPDWRATLRARFAAERGSQAAFARELEMSDSHLSLVLKGVRRLSYPLAERISKKTDIPVAELMSATPPLAPGGGE